VPERVGEVEKQVGQLQGQVEQAQARLDQADLNLSWTVVKAPQDGWITKRNVEEAITSSPASRFSPSSRPNDGWSPISRKASLTG